MSDALEQTAVTSPELDPDAVKDMGGLAELPGLEVVRDQLANVIAVIRAEAARREAGIPVARPAWKNLAFVGGPGSGKSRVAAAVGRIYRALGVLSSEHLYELTGVDLAGASSKETSSLVRDAAAYARHGVLLINDPLPRQQAYPQQLQRSLLEVLDHYRDDLIVILAGQADQLRPLLRSPALAARFPGVIEFAGYSPGQLAAIFAALAGEAGFTLTPAATRKATAVLSQAVSAEAGMDGGSARLAVRLLSLVTAAQARRVATARQMMGPTGLGAIRATDIPDKLGPPEFAEPSQGEMPGQYL